MKNAYIFDSLRTPLGKGTVNGSLYEVKSIDLLGNLLRSLQKNLQLDTSLVNDAIIGCVSPIGEQGYNIAKAALLHVGWAHTVSGLQINRFGASGLESLNLAAMKVRSGWEELIVAGGVESMSRTPIGSDGGSLLYDPAIINSVHYLPQGVAADLIATIEAFSREEIDQYALRSHQLALEATHKGYFKESIIPIHDSNGLLLLDSDENIRPDTTLEGLAQLQPSFIERGKSGFNEMAIQKFPELEKVNHVHTAGNSSGIVDGASIVLIGSKEAGKAIGIKPKVKITSVSTISVDPTSMLTGAAPAALKALDSAGMQPEDIDLWECSESFSAVALKFMKDLNLSPEKLNVNGGTIALGHPMGATGSILIGHLIDELVRRDLNTGLVTMGSGAGIGVATIIERV